MLNDILSWNLEKASNSTPATLWSFIKAMKKIKTL